MAMPLARPHEACRPLAGAARAAALGRQPTLARPPAHSHAGQGAAASVPFDRNNPVVAFLREIGLPQYAEPLLRSGFDDMETLLEIEDADMKDLGIPLFHVVKLRKRVQDLQKQKADTAGAVEENNPVVAFLRDIGLCQHASVLLRDGFDDMETLLEISDADLRDLGIPRGHVVKLRKRMGEWEQAQTQRIAPPAAQQVAQRPLCGVASRPHGPAPGAGRTAPMPTEGMASAVQCSWEQLQSTGMATVSDLLYKHTFTLCPETMGLFPAEVRHKYRDWTADEATDESDLLDSPALRKLFGKVLNAVGYAVAGMHEPARMVPMLTQLGARHIHYRVHESYWQVLGEALILTLRDCLGSSLTPEVERAWTTVYGFISAIMIEGMRTMMVHTKAISTTSGGSHLPSSPTSQLSSAPSNDTRETSSGRDFGLPDAEHPEVAEPEDGAEGQPVDGAAAGPAEVSAAISAALAAPTLLRTRHAGQDEVECIKVSLGHF